MSVTLLNNCEKAADALAKAFMHDPFYSAITADLPPEAPERHQCLVRYFVYSLQEAEKFGTLVVPAPDAYGASVWLFPQDSDTQETMDRDKKKFLAGLLGQRGLAHYEAIIGFMHPRAQQVVPQRNWYLSIAGVSPELQGRGLGERLLRPTLKEADQSGVCCYLETFNARSIRFYDKLGFTEVGSHLEPITNSRYWIMLREPHQA